MTGIMLDSTSPNAIGQAVTERREWRGMPVRAAALYLDGTFAAPASAFPALRRAGIKVVGITVTGTPGAHIGRIAGDIEPGDLTPHAGAQWAAAEREAGEWPVLYVNRDNKAATVSECLSRGITPGRDAGLWVATLDGTVNDTGGADLRHEPGVVAVQAFPAKMLGIDADGSVLTALGNTWLHLPPSWEAEALAAAHELVVLIEKHV
jgi:hypothetical protein